MNFFMKAIDVILHLDQYLSVIIQNYGLWTYLILFLILFCETGLVITPFLPGDSLLFIAGTFAAKGVLNVGWLIILLSVAAIIGDTVNYWMGSYFGEKIFLKKGLIKAEYLDKTKAFYQKHGGKTIIFARFIPIIRTFAPFIAGVGKMDYFKFISFNIIGGISWVTLFILGGYFFGGIPIIEENLTIVIMIIIVVSFVPAVFEIVKNYFSKDKKTN